MYGVQAVYITMCVHKCVHSCTCTLCENSDSVRNKNPKSLQVVLCVCAHVCLLHRVVNGLHGGGDTPWRFEPMQELTSMGCTRNHSFL